MEMVTRDIKSAQGRSLCIVLSQFITACSWSVLVSCKLTLLWTERCNCQVGFVFRCVRLLPRLKIQSNPIQSSILAR